MDDIVVILGHKGGELGIRRKGRSCRRRKRRKYWSFFDTKIGCRCMESNDCCIFFFGYKSYGWRRHEGSSDKLARVLSWLAYGKLKRKTHWMAGSDDMRTVDHVHSSSSADGLIDFWAPLSSLMPQSKDLRRQRIGGLCLPVAVNI